MSGESAKKLEHTLAEIAREMDSFLENIKEAADAMDKLLDILIELDRKRRSNAR
jgi:hypothetical protein